MSAIRHILSRPFSSALACSATIHGCVLLIVLWLAARDVLMPTPAEPRAHEPTPTATEVTLVVFLPRPGFGGGGGGGGNRMPGPVRRAEGIGTDRITLRIAKPAPLTASTSVVDRVPALPALVLDAVPLASGTRDVIGLPTGGVPDSLSTGTGSGNGVGTGTGTGIGSGTGPGLGSGNGGGTGGGVYHPGGSVTTPRLLSQVRPTYTADALARRVQGSVVIEMVVTADGVPAQMRVVRSLDVDLDQKAVEAVGFWRFEPGRLSGRPVSVLVTVVLDFTIH